MQSRYSRHSLHIQQQQYNNICVAKYVTNKSSLLPPAIKTNDSAAVNNNLYMDNAKEQKTHVAYYKMCVRVNI